MILAGCPSLYNFH